MFLKRANYLILVGLMALPPTQVLAQLNQANQGGLKSSNTLNKNAVGFTKSQLTVGRQYYISADRLNVRASTQTADSSNVVGRLALNDIVEIVDLLNEGTALVGVRIIKSESYKPKGDLKLYVSKDYLSLGALTQEVTGAGKYFVIQNVATEVTRVYERCTTTPDCPHRLVLETEMVVGRPEEGTRDDRYAFTTWLGHARISEWIKFYQDGQAHYPHWYRAGQSLSSIPEKAPGNAAGKPDPSFFWARKWTTKDGQGKDTIYGAFGWYAAKVTPGGADEGLNYQWMHGTIGWASDKQAPIQLTRTFMLNLFSNPGSAGCTRLSNGQVSFMRHLLPVGTDIYRVYAKEATRQDPCAARNFWRTCKQENIIPQYANQRSPKPWEYIMLTDGAQRSGGLTADADTIRRMGVPVIPGSNLIERGTVEIDQYPTPISLDYLQTAASGKSGDRYRIDEETGRSPTNFRGVFLVEEGRFVDYAHPSPQATGGKVRISGLKEFRSAMPAFMVASGSYFLQEPKYRTDNDQYKQKSDDTETLSDLLSR